MGRAETWQGFAQTLESVRTGVAAFELAHGESFYRYLAAHPEMHEAFVAAMSGWTEWGCDELARVYDFARFRTVLDAGGGLGSLLARILKKHPQLRGILFDQPATVALARQRFEAEGLADRCDLGGGSLLERVPEGADACILKHVLRDWDDAQAVRILRNCRQAMAPGGTLLVIEGVVDPRNGTDRVVKLVDLELGALVGGRLRTRAQYEALLAQAGFVVRRVHAVSVPDSQVVEACAVAPAVAEPHLARPLSRSGREATSSGS
jgi:SAM-dependent methyltransferase